MVDTRKFSVSSSKALDRFFSARSRALARNPRSVAPAVNNAGTYTLADGSTVTVTVSTSAPAGTNVRSYPTPGTRNLADYEKIASIEGGFRAAAYNNSVLAVGARQNGSATWTNAEYTAANGTRLSTETNSPAISFGAYPFGSASNSYRTFFLVDGQYIDLAGHAPATTSAVVTYYTLTFSNSKTRVVTLEMQMSAALQRIVIVDGASGGYAINRPGNEHKPRMLIFADSYGTADILDSVDKTQVRQFDGMYQQAADWLGVEAIMNAIGGTCFAGSYNSARPYPARWQDAVDCYAQQPFDAMHFHGSINAATLIAAATITADQERIAATSMLTLAAQTYPLMPITLSGCPTGRPGGATATAAATMEAAYAQAVTDAKAATGSKLISFIPWQDPNYVPNWPASGGSSLIYTDGVHPVPGVGGGQESFGRRFAADWFRAVQKMAA